MMSLQWTFIAVCLYAEIGILVLLLLPFISPTRWQKVFRSRLLTSVSQYSYIYFNVFIAILVLLFIDSIREVRRYSIPTAEVDLKHNPEAENVAHMKLFRSQRNFYIAGFALFLNFIIRRLVTCISQQAVLFADCEASKKQALSATEAARKMLEEKENKSNKNKEESEKGAEGTDVDKVHAEKMSAQELDDTKQQLEDTKTLLKRTQLDLESLRKQAEGTNTEYDRLLKEHTKIQEKLEAIESSGDKKGN